MRSYDFSKGTLNQILISEAVAKLISEDSINSRQFLEHMAKYNTSFAYKLLYKIQGISEILGESSQSERITRELTKALSKQTNVYTGESRATDHNTEQYNYDNLVAKEDVANKIKDINLTITDYNNPNINKAWSEALEKANAYPNTTMYKTVDGGDAFAIETVEGDDISCTKKGAQHVKTDKKGNRKIDNLKTTIVSNLPLLIRNSIKLNEYIDPNRGIEGNSYYTYFEDPQGNEYIVRFVVDKTNDLVEIDTNLSLHSAHGEKIKGPLTDVTSSTTSSPSNIVKSSFTNNIDRLINKVNDSIFKDELSMNVLKKLNGKNYTRTNPKALNVKYSLIDDNNENVGYHYGAKVLDNSKKSETLGQRGGRGTGAFGTGTYFFGSQQAPDHFYNNGENTEHKISFDGYNLFRPLTKEFGFDLHDYFKKLDDTYDYLGTVETEKDFDSKLEELKDLSETTEADVDTLSNIYNNISQSFGKNVADRVLSKSVSEDILNDNGWRNNINEILDSNYNPVPADEIIKVIDSEDFLNEVYKFADRYSEHKNLYNTISNVEEIQTNMQKIADILGVDYGDLEIAVNMAIEHAREDANAERWDTDSLGTRVMKELGFEGIDVRGIEGLDNSTYGSVIYDMHTPSEYVQKNAQNILTSKNDNDSLNLQEDNKEGASNEFRRIQEESERVLAEGSWGRPELHQFKNESIRRRYEGVFRKELGARGYSDSNPNGLLENTGDFKIYKNVDGQTFHDIFNTVRTYLPYGELVDVHPLETNEDWTGYNDTYNYLSNDGMCGFAITKDGDLISVFNASGKKGFLRSIAPFIKENAKTLDCYVLDPNISGTSLKKLYGEIFGFEVSNEEDYNWDYDHDGIGERYNEPKIAYMYNPNLVENNNQETEPNEEYPLGPSRAVGQNIEAEYQRNIDKYGAFKPGEEPRQGIKVPKATDYGKTKQFARNFAEALNLTTIQNLA